MSKPLNVEAALDSIIARDTRYRRDAYCFVRDALDLAQKKLSKTGNKFVLHRPLHVTGQQLLETIRCLALERFGPKALAVLEGWGVCRCEDFGDIVFNMVESSLLGVTENDSRDDFKGGYDFSTAFPQSNPPAAAR